MAKYILSFSLMANIDLNLEIYLKSNIFVAIDCDVNLVEKKNVASIF